MEARTWPALAEQQRCHAWWKLASTRERQLLTSIEGKLLVRRLKISTALLKEKAAKSAQDACEAAAEPCSLDEAMALAAAATEEERCLHGLAELAYDARLTIIEFSERFCGRPDAFEQMLEGAACTVEEREAITTEAACGNLLDAQNEAMTWQALARIIFTLALTACLVRSAAAPALCKQLRWSLELPREAKLRSWPSKKQLELLRQCWARSSIEGRTTLTTLTGQLLWWMYSGDLIVGAGELSGRELALALMHRKMFKEGASILDSCRKGVGLEDFVGLEGHEKMFFTETFAASPKALDFLVKNAVAQLSVKEQLMRAVGSVQDASGLEAATIRLLQLFPARIGSWRGLATLACTLVLEVLVSRCEAYHATEVHFQKLDQLRWDEEAEAKQKRVRKKEKQRAKAKEMERVRLEEDVSTAAGSSSATSVASHASEESAWPSLSELPCERPIWFVRNTFVETEDKERQGARLRAASCPLSAR